MARRSEEDARPVLELPQVSAYIIRIMSSTSIFTVDHHRANVPHYHGMEAQPLQDEGFDGKAGIDSLRDNGMFGSERRLQDDAGLDSSYYADRSVFDCVHAGVLGSQEGCQRLTRRKLWRLDVGVFR